ncbi:MAG: hypothetical protein ACE5JS_18425 [Nitrospinota bacterium]
MSKRSGKRRKKADPVAQGSKRRQFGEFLRKILNALNREDGFQEAEELIAELKGSTGRYLPGFVRQIEEAQGKERLDLLNLIAHLEDPEAVPYLETLIFESPIDVAAKRRAAEILEQLGNPLEVGMAECLENAAAILERIPNLKPGSLHGSHPFFVKFVQLPPVLRQATLIELASSAPQTALNFIELIRSREHKALPETIEALVILKEPHAGKILQEYLEGTPDKQTARLVRRALYRLKTGGTPIQEEGVKTRSEGRGIFRPLVTPPQGFMSVVDGPGTKAVWLAKPLPGGGRLLFQAIVSEERGLVDFAATEISLRSFRSYVEEITAQDQGIPVSEVPAGYAAHLMEEAHRLSQQRKGEIPQDFPIHQHQIVDLVGEERLDLPGKLQERQVEPVGEMSSKEMGDLLEQPEFSDWVMGEEEISPFVEEVKSLSESRLIISRGTRQEQVEEICKRAAASLFDRNRLQRLANRLEDTAYVLLMAAHKEPARSAAALAKNLWEFDGDPAGHPFLRGIVLRSVLARTLKEIPAEDTEGASATRAGEEAKREKPSLIITPGEAR